jgi:hypothetical protein
LCYKRWPDRDSRHDIWRYRQRDQIRTHSVQEVADRGVEGTTLRSRELEYQRALRDKVVEEMFPRLADSAFKVADSYKIGDAHKLIERNQTQGKIICLVD